MGRHRQDPQLDLFAAPAAPPVSEQANTTGEWPTWVSGSLFRADRHGIGAYVHLVRAPDDPERRPRPVGGQEDKQPHLTLAKSTLKDWVPRLRQAFVDGQPRTFNRLAVELLDLTADVVFESPVDEALWWLVDMGELEHTLVAPVLFRPRALREETCKPCRDDNHHDHHGGVWVRADGSDPVLCRCPRCHL